MGLGSVVKGNGLGSGSSENAVSLKRLIREHYRRVEHVEPIKKGGSFRASAFASMCPREEVLCAIHDLARTREVDADLSLIFAHGKGLHHILQNEVLPSSPDLLVGRWKCLHCGSAYGPDPYYKAGKFEPERCVPQPKSCVKCNKRSFAYDELLLFSDEFKLGGHPDGFLNIPGQPGLGVLEAKSIGRSWKIKNVPDMGHVVQAHIYMWLADLKWSVIFYWDKATNGLDGLIEHYIERDDETIERIQETARVVFATLEPWWEAKSQGLRPAFPVLPERICATAECERANECGVAKLCFASP